MSFLIDTDICSAYLRSRREVEGRFLLHGGQLHISIVTVAELSTWVSRSNSPTRRREGFERLLRVVEIVPLDMQVARRFGQIEAVLLDRGQRGGELDLLIAATALVQGFHLVTHNTKDFANIPDLMLLDWLTT